MRVSFASATDTGLRRSTNEDSLVVRDDLGLFVVADGMGGQCAGEKASELATEIVPRRLDALIDFDGQDAETVSSNIDEAVSEANAEILALSEIDPNYHNMGTTITFIVAVADQLYVGGIGDSRVYQLRGAEFKQLTTDHSLTRALVEAGTITEEEAVTHRYRNVLYRYLGSKEGGAGAESKEIKPESGDRYFICSDGVTDGIEDAEIQQLLGSVDDPQEAAEAIVQAALDGGSKDNVTCVVVHVE